MNWLFAVAMLLCFAWPQNTVARQAENDHRHHDHAMRIDRDRVVMNENLDRLPRDCEAISRDYRFTVHAGIRYASGEPGVIFGMSEPELRVEPCSRVEITFVNEDGIRHQWMLHGLPRYLYPAGMFHLEAAGGQTASGTFIVPGENQTYLVHCDMAQHMEKGMRAQLVVGSGSGDLWGVPGVSDTYLRDNYLPPRFGWWVAVAALGGAVMAAGLLFLLSSRR